MKLIGPPTAILELLGKGRPDPFTTLVQTVCHQQLSVKVCQAMFQRLLNLCGDRDAKTLYPERVVAESADRIREVAKLSYRKIEYIRRIAERFLDGTLNDEVFEEASDDELRERMTQLPGIGEWTLERPRNMSQESKSFSKAIEVLLCLQGLFAVLVESLLG